MFLTMSFVAMAMCMQAQLRIDINNYGRNPNEGTEPGYEPWTFGRVPSAEGTFTDVNGNEIKIIISAVPDMEGNAVRTTTSPEGIRQLPTKLWLGMCR